MNIIVSNNGGEPNVDERVNQCWLTGFTPPYDDSKAVAFAHIKDKIFCSPTEDYDLNNRIRLRQDLHALFDSRCFYINSIGRVCWQTDMSDHELEKLGMKRDAQLHPSLMTKERIHYIGQRVINYPRFRLLSDLAQQAAKNDNAESKKRGLPNNPHKAIAASLRDGPVQ